ncbi:hypothetical protein ZWY2020_006395 [Hordeum vulgare]|nr:hypothetical protein ZWY2020_006395 [Hordeum vulgare]
MHFNGAFARMGAGTGVLLTSPMGDRLRYAMQLCFQREEKVSNNIVEYEGLIAALKVSMALGVQRLTVMGDPQLHVNFSNKEYTPKNGHMEAYLQEESRVSEERLFKPTVTPSAEGPAPRGEELPQQRSRGLRRAARPRGLNFSWLWRLKMMIGCRNSGHICSTAHCVRRKRMQNA